MEYLSLHPLVTVFGGAGYIGSILVRRLLEAEFRVRVFDNYLFGNEGVRKLRHPHLELIEGDVCDIRAVSAATDGAEIVVHLASLIGRRIKDLRRADLREVNLLGATTVLDTAIEHGVSRYLFASSESVYGAQSGIMYETGTPEPVSLYSRLKLRMEERVINSAKRGFHPTVLRIATCHGFSPRMRFDLVLNGMVRDAIMRKSIVLPSGDSWRSFIHVEDVTDAFLACLQSHPNLVSGEIFNLGSQEQNLQLKQLANLVQSAYPETSIEYLNEEPDLVDYHLSCSKIEKILDFRPRWTIEASVIHMRDILLEQVFESPYSLKYHNT